MTGALLVSRKHKNKLAAKKNKSPSDENIAKYKDYNRIYRALIKKLKLIIMSKHSRNILIILREHGT